MGFSHTDPPSEKDASKRAILYPFLVSSRAAVRPAPGALLAGDIEDDINEPFSRPGIGLIEISCGELCFKAARSRDLIEIVESLAVRGQTSSQG